MSELQSQCAIRSTAAFLREPLKIGFPSCIKYKAKISNSGLLTQIKLPVFSRGVLVDLLLSYSETVLHK